VEKKTYYVSVQAGTVLENEGDAAYEFEIQATEQEVEDLIETFGLLHDLDNTTAVRGISPAVPYHQDQANDDYDTVLTQVYRKLYELGNEETKQIIANMGMIGEQERPVR
jgi:hypothetical protein